VGPRRKCGCEFLAPAAGRLGRPVGQHVDDLASFEVDHDRPVTTPPLPSPFIYPDHPHRRCLVARADAGADPWKKTDAARARQLLAASGYRGEHVALLDSVDQPEIHVIALLTAAALKKAGVTVDLQSMDWSTVITRRNTREAPSANKSGWDLAFTLWGGFSLSSPLTNTPLVTSCDGSNLYGWPCDEPLEKLRGDFLDASSDADRMHVIEQLQTRYFDVVPYVSTGIFLRQVAYRSNLSGVLKIPYPVMWNISKN
jgi:peptide/nickel transport system substrate-binding protein